MERRRKPAEYSRFYINLASKSDINPAKLIGLLLDTNNDRSINIGRKDIMKGFSFFEVEKSQEQLILRSFNKNVRRSRQLIKVELTNETYGDHLKRNPQEQYPYGNKKVTSKLGEMRRKGVRG